MPRYAITQVRALTTIYTDAPDTLDAVNWARRVLIDHARHGNLEVSRLPDVPYDEGDARSEARYEENDDDRETERLRGLRLALFSPENDSEGPEPW